MKISNIQDIKAPPQGSTGTVFVTGVTGQDGSHMVDYLLKNTNHFIIGGARRLSVDNHENINHLEFEPRFQLVNFDLTDSHSIYKLVEKAKPDYFINFAAQSFVASSWDFARQTWQTNSTAVLDCLEAIRCIRPTCRFYNAGSSEEFGNVAYTPQDEKHPMRPRSPYGASKAAARQLIKVYRESFDIYAVQGWLFNHEGTRRGPEFVTRKITKGVAKISADIKFLQQLSWTGSIYPIELGNIDAMRDWSDAEDMVDGVWRMLNQEKYNVKGFLPSGLEFAQVNDYSEYTLCKDIVPKIQDYVASSGESRTIREFVEESFRVVGIEGTWVGHGVGENYMATVDGQHICLVSINPKFYRPAEVNVLCGNSHRIREELGWNPKTTFKQLVKKMVDNDLEHVKRSGYPINEVS